MALNPKTCTLARDACLNAFATHLGASPKFRGYDGAQPTDSDTALGAQVVLFDCAMSATPYGASSSASMTAAAITADSSADATGTLAWCSQLTSGNVRKQDGSAGTGTVNCVANTASIVSGANVSITSCVETMAA